MKVLIIGGGGREHALAWKIHRSPRVTKIYCAPGNAGIASLAECVPIAAEDVLGLRAFAQEHRIDFTIVGPEAPLAAGIVDVFRDSKLLIFGPHKAAARIESSKSFSKELMRQVRIPTADAKTFTALGPALEYLEQREAPIVVKADGLAQGKGVVVAHSRAEARDAVVAMLEEKAFGEAGARIVIEEFLKGDEVTVMAFTDGRTIIPMIAAQDHKRLGNADTGPNTGGMGAYAPAPFATPFFLERVRRLVLERIVEGLSRMGSPFQGVIYAGLIIVDGEPRVLEFNARMGDPETQVVLPLLKTDLMDLLQAVSEHRLEEVTVEWQPAAAVSVIIAARGYPGAVIKGAPISGLSTIPQSDSLLIFHSGTLRDPKNDGIVTAGGRVLAVTGVGKDVAEARRQAYAGVESIHFDGMQWRSDIGIRAPALRDESQQAI